MKKRNFLIFFLIISLLLVPLSFVNAEEEFDQDIGRDIMRLNSGLILGKGVEATKMNMMLL